MAATPHLAIPTATPLEPLASFAQGRRQMGLRGTRATDQDQIVRGLHKPGAGQLLELCLRQRRFRPIDAGKIPMHREPR